jgi:hypothetical protein
MKGIIPDTGIEDLNSFGEVLGYSMGKLGNQAIPEEMKQKLINSIKNEKNVFI